MKIKFLMFSLLLCLLLGGCGKMELPIETSSVEPMPAEPPPYMLLFRSMEELDTFFAATEMPDASFADYVDRNGYDMNGIRSKENLLALMEQLAEVPFPEISGGVLSTVSIEPERGWLDVLYGLENEDSVSFELKFTERHEDQTQADFEPAFQKSTSHWFKGMVDGYTISCGYFGSEDAALEAMEEREITFRPMAELYFREETAKNSVPVEPPERALVFYSIKELRAFFAAAETAELKDRLAAAPFPEVSGGVLDDVSIDVDGEQAYVRYTFAPDEYCMFRIDYGKQTDHDTQREFTYAERDEKQGVYGFESKVKGYCVAYWYYGGIKAARAVIDKQTTYRSWANVWEKPPIKDREFSSLEEFETAVDLAVYYIPQGIPEGYTLERIVTDSAYVTFYYFPAHAKDVESRRIALLEEQCFEFSFGYQEPDKVVDTEIIWNEDYRVYVWRLGGHTINLKIPKDYSVQPDEAAILCAVETVIQ